MKLFMILLLQALLISVLTRHFHYAQHEKDPYIKETPLKTKSTTGPITTTDPKTTTSTDKLSAPTVAAPAPYTPPTQPRAKTMSPTKLMNEIKLSEYQGQLEFSMYVNEEDKIFDMAIDLNFSHIWMADNSCDDCFEANIDVIDSYLSKNCLKSQNLNSLQYKQTKFLYTTCSDLFSFQYRPQETKFLFNLTFYLVKQVYFQTPFQGFYSGILGLGFNQYENNSFLNHLKIQGKINKKEFSIYFTENDYNNVLLIIGGKNESLATGIWSYCYLETSRGWLFDIDFISFLSKEGDVRATLAINPKSNEFQLFAEKTIVDVNLHKIELYEVDFLQLIKILRETYSINCFQSHFIKTIFSCDNNDQNQYPNLQIFMCDGLFTIPPEQYLKCEDGCRINIQFTKEKQIRLGRSFLKYYYSHFIEEPPRRIGFANLVGEYNK